MIWINTDTVGEWRSVLGSKCGMEWNAGDFVWHKSTIDLENSDHVMPVWFLNDCWTLFQFFQAAFSIAWSITEQ